MGLQKGVEYKVNTKTREFIGKYLGTEKMGCKKKEFLMFEGKGAKRICFENNIALETCPLVAGLK